MQERRKQMNINFPFTLGVVYITGWLVFATTQVGESFDSSGVYSLGLPIGMFCLTIVPFVLGILSNRRK